MAKSKTTPKPGARIAVFIVWCFFFSGLTGLVYEILWTRMLVRIIGTAPFAVSIVLTIFMGGLGVGSFLAGRVVDRVSEPGRLIRIYGLLELVIGVYGLLLPVLLGVFKPIYAIIYNQLFDQFILYQIVTFIGCSLLLALPVICMGATLPVLCRFYASKSSELATRIGRLYGINTIGAAIGALICGFWLIEFLGVWGSLVFAVSVNVVIGVSCLVAGSGTKGAKVRAKIATAVSHKPNREGTATEIEAGGYSIEPIMALVIFGVSGFCGMAYEVIWTKLLGLIVGPTTYSFTIVLVTFIAALAGGSIIFGRVGDRTKRPMTLLICTQIAAGLLALGVSQFLGVSQLFFAKLIFQFKEQFLLLNIAKAVSLFAFMVLPTLCLGAAFPLVGKLCTRSVSQVGRSIGSAYAVNTAGAVAGSFCAGFVLVPLLGKENGLSFVVGLQLLTVIVVSAILLIKQREDFLRRFGLVLAGIVGLILCFNFPVWSRKALSNGKYHRFEEIGINVQSCGWFESIVSGAEKLSRADRGEVVFYGDGIGGFTTVLRYAQPMGRFKYVMVNSGKSDASNFTDMSTQTLLAHFPMLFHRGAKSVMVLGLGSGVTAGEILHWPVERVDVLEISREVVEASRFFRPWNNDVLSDPRTNLIVQDGRAHLQLTRQKYDVITSEPSNPWMAGLANLFTYEFFSAVKDRLNANGIFVQWVHAYQIDLAGFALIGRTFEKVFPNSLLALTTPTGATGDFLLVGFKGRKGLEPAYANKNLKYAQKSTNIKLADARLLYRLVASEQLNSLFGAGAINTDNRPKLEFAAPRLMYFNNPQILANVQANGRFSRETSRLIRQVTTDVDAQIDFAEFALSVQAPFGGMVDFARAGPVQKKRFFEILETYCESNLIDYSVLISDELKRRCRLIQIETLRNRIDDMPDKALSYSHMAELLQADNRLDEAVAGYSRSLQIRPDNADAHNNLGTVLAQQGKLDEGIAHFNEAIRTRPGFIEAHNNLGHALLLQGRVGEAAKEYRQSLQLSGGDAQIHNSIALAFVRQGKFDQAVTHFKETMRIAPEFADAYSNLGYVLLQQDKIDEAIIQYRRAVEIEDTFGEAHYNLGYALFLTGQVPAAIEAYGRAVELMPENAEAHNDLGAALYHQGRHAEAIGHFKQAVRIRPDFADAKANLAAAGAKQNDSAVSK